MLVPALLENMPMLCLVHDVFGLDNFLSGNKEEDRFEYKYGDDVFVPEHPPYKETLLFHEPGKQTVIDMSIYFF